MIALIGWVAALVAIMQVVVSGYHCLLWGMELRIAAQSCNSVTKRAYAVVGARYRKHKAAKAAKILAYAVILTVAAIGAAFA